MARNITVSLAILLLVSGSAKAELLRLHLLGEDRQLAALELPNAAQLLAVMDTIGLQEAGPPVTVRIVGRDSPEARMAPSWAVGYAIPAAGQIVLIPARAPSYPHSRLQQVLLHEIAHVLTARAANRQTVPRWFSEGLAMVASREWQLIDRARTLIAGWTIDLESLDRLFQEGPRSASSAYAISGSFVRYLIGTHGPDAPGRILGHVGRGLSFESAYQQTTGITLAIERQRFARHLDLWTRWIPLLTSSAVLWMLITTLALVAFVRRRQRDEALRRRWIEEEFDPSIN